MYSCGTKGVQTALRTRASTRQNPALDGTHVVKRF